jgi:uncharacterized protein YbjT (DUF2867 family)
MKIVVIGGTGLIGSKLVTQLSEQGHEVVPASPRLGINTITGEGVADALEGASVVVDVSNSPNFEYAVAMEFFQTSTRNLLAAAVTAGVGHVVALSVVGTSALAENGDPETTTAGYFRAKLAQERMLAAAGIPYTIVHATQFFEFINAIADEATDGSTVRLPAAYFQPIAADDVAKGLARIAVGTPANGIVEIGGPEPFRLDELIRRVLGARNDPREVVTDDAAGYFGIRVDERTLVPGDGAVLGEMNIDDWLSQAPAGVKAG